MPNKTLALDGVFHALSSPTRRQVLATLTHGPAPMTELAKPFKMALPSFLQHLQVLEKAGLVRSQKTGRVRVFELQEEPMKEAEQWLQTQRRIWETRFDQLDSLLLGLKEKEQ